MYLLVSFDADYNDDMSNKRRQRHISIILWFINGIKPRNYFLHDMYDVIINVYCSHNAIMLSIIFLLV